MKRRWLLSAVAAILAGGALHFLYALWPNALSAVFAPVNESVWEHLKLLYWPFLAAAFCLTRGAQAACRRWCGLLLGLLAAPVLLLGLYYTLAGGFAVRALAVDLLLYVLSMSAGFFLAWRLRAARFSDLLRGVLVIASGVYGAALTLLSLAPPQLPIFQPPL